MLSGTPQAPDAFRHIKLNSSQGAGTMRYETGTFELHGNDMYVRELTFDETNEVVGGTGLAQLTIIQSSGAASTQTVNATTTLVTSNTAASVAATLGIVAAGANNALTAQAITIVT
jgi:hypothetical protein